MANTFANAVYNEDQRKKLMEIYKNQGAGAVTSAALGMMAQGAATQANTAGGSSNPGAVSSVAIPTGAAAASGASARSQRINEALTAANANASPPVKSLTSERTNAIMDANARKTTPYMAAIAAADQGANTSAAPTSTQGGRMEDGSFRLGDGSTYDSLQGAIDANAAASRAKNQYEITTGENGETLYDGMPLMNGTGILAYKGDAGKITSSLAYPDAHVRTADGRLIGSDYSGGPDANYLHGLVKVGNYIYDYDTMTDDELLGIGMVRDAHGVRIANDNDRMMWALQNGADPEAIGYGRRIAAEKYGYEGNTTPQNTTPQGDQSTAPLPQGGGYGGGSTVPLPQGGQSTVPRNTGGSQGSGYGGGSGGGTYPSGTAGYTPYQLALDQFDYGKAPEWTGTDYETQRDEALQNARNMRWDGSDYQRQRDEALQNAMNPYEGSPYDQQRNDALAAYGEAWQGSEYQPKRDEALQRAENMQWNYDPNADPVWQALQKQYRREGDRATRNALGQAASMTGGVPSSYAVTAASQAGDYYAAQLSDRLPQVYQDAYNRYLQEFQRQMGISDQYQGFDDREYSRWADQQGKNLDLADRYNQYGQQDYNQYMDRVSQQLQGADRYNGYDQTEYQRYLDRYGQELDAADRLNNYGSTEYGRYQDRLGQWNTDRNFQYGLNRDAVSDARYADETAYERAWNEENRDYSRNYQARRDAILDNRADREWAQELKEYADAQNWKATEWQQYLREYEDQLSDKEREWVYQMSRDAEDDKRYWTDYEYQKTRDAVSDAQYADETAYKHQQDELEWKYKQDEFNYKKEQDEKSWQYTEDQDAYKKLLDDRDTAQQEEENKNRDYLEAIAFLRTYGIVEGRYAKILGVPDGTTRDAYWARYGGGDSEEQQPEAPQSGGYSGGGYTGGGYTGGDDGAQAEPETAPAANPAATETVPGVIHENGTPMTKGFQDWWKTIRDAYDQGASREEIIQAVDSLIRQGVIADYEKEVILRKLGLYTWNGTASGLETTWRNR